MTAPPPRSYPGPVSTLHETVMPFTLSESSRAHLVGVHPDLVRVGNRAIEITDTAMKNAARQVRIPIEWGGDWKTFRDGPHFQLPWNRYP